jgi:hypothetical protein
MRNRFSVSKTESVNDARCRAPCRHYRLLLLSHLPFGILISPNVLSSTGDLRPTNQRPCRSVHKGLHADHAIGRF